MKDRAIDFFQYGFSINASYLTERGKSYSLVLSNPRNFESLKFLKEHKDVSSLIFPSIKPLSRSDWPLLANLCSLEKLSFWNCEDLKNESVSWVLKNSFLKELNLGNCKGISDEVFEGLSCTHRLEIVNLAGCLKITDKALNFISKLKYLRSLNLSFCRISDLGIKLLEKNTLLQLLSLNSCKKISEKGIQTISGLSSLKQIWLNSCTCLDAQSLKAIQKLPFLEALHIGGTLLQDDDLRYLPSQLISLGLGWMDNLTDQAIGEIIKLEKLEKLILNRCKNLTEKGIQLLGKLPRLRVLDLRNCSLLKTQWDPFFPGVELKWGDS